MLQGLYQAIWPLLIVLPLCALVEAIASRQRYSVYALMRGALFTTVTPITAFCIGLYARGTFAFEPFIHVADLPSWLVIIGLLVLRDFFNYWDHRFEHAFLWSVHSVHHAETELQAANDYAHPISALSELFVIVLPMTLLDTGDISIPLWVSLAVLVRSKLNHSPLRIHFGPFWRVMVDHRFHRIHHSLEERHFGKNFGTVFTFWDQLFGTAYFPHRNEWPDVGLADSHRAESLLEFVAWPVLYGRSRTDTSAHRQAGPSEPRFNDPARQL